MNFTERTRGGRNERRNADQRGEDPGGLIGGIGYGCFQQLRGLLAHETAELSRNGLLGRLPPVRQSCNRDDDEQDRSDGRHGVKRDRRTAAQRFVVDEGKDSLLRQVPKLGDFHGFELAASLQGQSTSSATRFW